MLTSLSAVTSNFLLEHDTAGYIIAVLMHHVHEVLIVHVNPSARHMTVSCIHVFVTASIHMKVQQVA